MGSAASPYSVAKVVSGFVLSRSPGAVVSTGDGIFAIRQLMPWCQRSNDELASIIAETAIRQGRNVAFDVGRRESDVNLSSCSVRRSTAAVAPQ